MSPEDAVRRRAERERIAQGLHPTQVVDRNALRELDTILRAAAKGRRR